MLAKTQKSDKDGREHRAKNSYSLESNLELHGQPERAHAYDPVSPQARELVWGQGRPVVKVCLLYKANVVILQSLSQCPVDSSQIYQQFAKEVAS